MDDNSTKNKLKGKANQAVGATREKAGAAVGNDGMEERGRAQHMKGDAQENTGKLEGALGDAARSAKDAAGKAAEKVKDATRR